MQPGDLTTEPSKISELCRVSLVKQNSKTFIHSESLCSPALKGTKASFLWSSVHVSSQGKNTSLENLGKSRRLNNSRESRPTQKMVGSQCCLFPVLGGPGNIWPFAFWCCQWCFLLSETSSHYESLILWLEKSDMIYSKCTSVIHILILMFMCIWVRILQRHKMNRMHRYVSVSIDIYREKERDWLTSVIMEVDRSQDLQLTNWRPRRQHYSPSSEACRSRLRKSQCFHSVQRQKKKQKFQLKALRKKEIPSYTWEYQSLAFLFYLGFKLIEWGLPTMGREICFTRSTHASVNLLQKHSHRHPQNDVWPMPGHPVAQSSWHIKLKTTMYVFDKNDIKYLLVSRIWEEIEKPWN